MQSFTFNTAPSVIFGSGSIGRIGEIAATRLGPYVMLVTDAGLVEAGLVAPVLDSLHRAGIAAELYAEVVADPPESVILDAVA